MPAVSFTMAASRRPWWPSLAAACVVIGCGRLDGTVPVTGRVAFAGGRPPAECVVMFVPLGGTDGPLRAGKAVCDVDGSFEATTFRLGDGLVPGRYKALLRCVVSGSTEMEQPGSAVPEGFAYPVFDVIPESPGVRLTIDVPARLPANPTDAAISEPRAAAVGRR
jgi:hypothetical protein